MQEFQALSEVRSQAQKDSMLGFQFMATVISRCHGNDVNFMPDSEPAKLLSLDDFEGWFKARAEANEKINGKPKELGD